MRTDQGVGSSVGRFVLLEVLGRGGGGVVYKAHDTRLDRKAAVKLLRSHALGVVGEGAHEARLRLVREAQAMARISHENVLTIFDAATHEGEV